MMGARRFLSLLIAAIALSGCTRPRSARLEPAGIPVYVKQDQFFSYVLESPETGAFTITDALPPYVTFYSDTSTLSGVLRKYSEQFSFGAEQRRGKGSATMGPYRIKLLGNPLKEQQWHLQNTGQTGYALRAGTAGEDIHLVGAIQNGITGAGVTVAVSDTGTVISHEGLTENVLSGQSRNYLEDPVMGQWSGDPTPDTSDPENAHGTAVAGLIAEAGWNGLGGRGVAPEAKFAAFLFLQAQSKLSTDGLLTAGINDQFVGSFDIFNFSWGESQCAFSQASPTFFSTLLNGVTAQRSGKGSLFVQASGNSFQEELYTCFDGMDGSYYGSAEFSDMQTTPYTIVVGALNADGVIASYSSPGANVWVSAPGGEFGMDQVESPEIYGKPALITTDFPGCELGLKSLTDLYSSFNAGANNSGCKYTNTMNGTSGAAPIVSGAIALLLDANPDLTWRDVKYILARSADKVDPGVNPVHHPDNTLDLSGHVYELPWVTNAAGYHFHNYYGFGRVNVDAAIALAQGFVSPLGTMTSTSVNDTSVQAVPDGSATGATHTYVVAAGPTVEAVQVKVSVSDCILDLGLELTSPSGTKSILMNINSQLQDSSLVSQTFLSNAFYGEDSDGTWTLKAIDGHAGCTANLTASTIIIHGH